MSASAAPLGGRYDWLGWRVTAAIAEAAGGRLVETHVMAPKAVVSSSWRWKYSIIIAVAGLVSAMDVRPVRPGRQERRLAERLRQRGLEGVPVSATQARGALTKTQRRDVSADEVADALDRLVAAGLAARQAEGEWVLRARGSEAWFRLSLRAPDE